MILEEFVNKNHAAFYDQLGDWKEAITKGCEILEKDGSVTPEYKEKIIETVDNIGPYFIVAPEIAVSHSQNDYSCVNKKGISLLVLKEPVYFESQPVKILFTLASKEPNEHLDSMLRLSEMLLNPELVSELKEADSSEKLLELDKNFPEI